MGIDDIVERIEQRVESMDERLKALEQRFLSNEHSRDSIAEKKLSLNEFISMKRPRDDIRRVMLVFYYREVIERHSSNGTRDIRETMMAAKQPLPVNLSMCVSRLVRRGWIQKSNGANGELDSWELTATGAGQIQRMPND